MVIPRGCGSSSDTGQAWHQSLRDVDDTEPRDIYVLLCWKTSASYIL